MFQVAIITASTVPSPPAIKEDQRATLTIFLSLARLAQCL